MRLRLLVLLFGSLVVHVYEASAAGSTAAALLRLGVGAKNVAMGETGAAENEISAAYWNPAGLAGIARRGFSFMHAIWLSDISFQNAIYAQRLGGGGFALSGTYLSMPAINKYDNTGLLQSDTYQPSDAVVGISCALPVREIPVGVSLKYITSQIDGRTATAFAADVGAMFNTTFSGRELRLGVSAQNLGTTMKFINESFSLPLNLKAGAAYVFSDQLTGALDVNKSIDSDIIGNAGIQYLFSLGEHSSLSGRAGYRSNVTGLGGLAGLAAGLGFGYRGIQVDYAFVPYGDLDNTHRISLTYNF